MAEAFVTVLWGASKVFPCSRVGVRHAPAMQSSRLGDGRWTPRRTLGALYLSDVGKQRASRPGGCARQGVSEAVGFDIEVKLATPDDLAATPAAEVERMVAPILAAVRAPAHAATLLRQHTLPTPIPAASRSPCLARSWQRRAPLAHAALSASSHPTHTHLGRSALPTHAAELRGPRASLLGMQAARQPAPSCRACTTCEGCGVRTTVGGCIRSGASVQQVSARRSSECAWGAPRRWSAAPRAAAAPSSSPPSTRTCAGAKSNRVPTQNPDS